MISTTVQKTALVTGSARRIGAAIVKKLHEAGFRVIIHCHHSEKEANQLAKELNTLRSQSAMVICEDLVREKAASRVISLALEWSKRLDVLVNNASDFVKNPLDSFDEALWDHLYSINTKAPFALSIAARKVLSETKGVIINITDIHAEKPLKGYSIYCQTKAALLMQTLSLAKEFAPEIRVNAIAPGAILWPEEENLLNSKQKELIIAKTPLKKHGDPKYIAQAVLALVENEFVTGQVLRVDGGRSIGW